MLKKITFVIFVLGLFCGAGLAQTRKIQQPKPPIDESDNTDAPNATKVFPVFNVTGMNNYNFEALCVQFQKLLDVRVPNQYTVVSKRPEGTNYVVADVKLDYRDIHFQIKPSTENQAINGVAQEVQSGINSAIYSRGGYSAGKVILSGGVNAAANAVRRNPNQPEERTVKIDVVINLHPAGDNPEWNTEKIGVTIFGFRDNKPTSGNGLKQLEKLDELGLAPSPDYPQDLALSVIAFSQQLLRIFGQ